MSINGIILHTSIMRSGLVRKFCSTYGFSCSSLYKIKDSGIDIRVFDLVIICDSGKERDRKYRSFFTDHKDILNKMMFITELPIFGKITDTVIAGYAELVRVYTTIHSEHVHNDRAPVVAFSSKTRWSLDAEKMASCADADVKELFLDKEFPFGCGSIVVYVYQYDDYTDFRLDSLLLIGIVVFAMILYFITPVVTTVAILGVVFLISLEISGRIKSEGRWIRSYRFRFMVFLALTCLFLTAVTAAAWLMQTV